MVLAKGSTFKIGKYIGALAEDYTVRFESEFGSIADDLQDTNMEQLLNIAGATAKSLSGGAIGFSSQFKQLGTQVWKGSSPASVSIGVTFDRKSNAEADIMELVRNLCAFPLPAEGGLLGSLIPPGPSPIEGIGLDSLIKKSPEEVAGDTYVNFTIGNMKFNRYLMKSSEPTFNKFTDDSGYPISVTIQFDFISMWIATKNTPLGW
jgi:hypothetical protein